MGFNESLAGLNFTLPLLSASLLQVREHRPHLVNIPQITCLRNSAIRPRLDHL